MKQTILTPQLHEYMQDVSLREHPVLKALREETSKMALAGMQVSPEEAQFLQLLIKMTGAKKILELGTFTGYSALAMALAMPEEGKLITCDINAEWTKNAPYFWQQADMLHKIDLKLGPALDTLSQWINKGETQQFDFIFIDADKTNYLNYYELALQLIKPNGLIAIDNIFWDGKVVDASDKGAQTREIKRLNEVIKNDNRVDISLLAIADGLFLIRPK